MVESEYSNDALLALERSLKSNLSPVELDQKFVGNLRQRLEESPAYQQSRLAVTMLAIAAGLVVGLAIFLIGRGFLHQKGEG